MSIKANITIDQGADFQTEIAVVDIDGIVIDLTGYTATAYLKKEWSSATKTAFTVDVTEEDGLLTISMTHAQTANLEPRDYVWACDVNAANIISRVCSGKVLVEPSPDWTTYVEPEEE